MLAHTATAFARSTYDFDSSTTRVDIALLVSVLFLQRFSLPFGTTRLGLDLVAIGLILLYQFLSGKLLIQYDRLLWFLPFALTTTCSLLLNFSSTMLTAYSQFTIFSALLTLSRPSTDDQYKGTLQVFQSLVVILSCLAVVQFAAHLAGEEDRLIKFYGLVPDSVLGGAQVDRIPPSAASHFRSNGIFLGEASTLSQITALGILIEVLEFRRPRYLLAMTVGFLLAYSGTGSMLLLLCLPLAGLHHGKAGLSVLLVVICALALFATGIIELSAFSSRVGEFEDTRASGFQRFVSPFWAAAQLFDMEALQALLLGSGPGTAKMAVRTWYGWADYIATWAKMFHEYGLIGSFIFACFLTACLRKSRCPGLLVAAIIFAYAFLQGMLTITIPLCTLSGPERRGGRLYQTDEYRSSLVAGSAAQ
jgi:hypothetical protein